MTFNEEALLQSNEINKIYYKKYILLNYLILGRTR